MLSVVIGPAVAVGGSAMKSPNVAESGVHVPPSLTIMVSVMTPAVVWSWVPKVYVGVGVVAPAVNVPSPLVIQVIPVPGDPFVAVYPAGMV